MQAFKKKSQSIEERASPWPAFSPKRMLSGLSPKLGLRGEGPKPGPPSSPKPGAPAASEKSWLANSPTFLSWSATASIRGSAGQDGSSSTLGSNSTLGSSATLGSSGCREWAGSNMTLGSNASSGSDACGDPTARSTKPVGALLEAQTRHLIDVQYWSREPARLNGPLRVVLPASGCYAALLRLFSRSSPTSARRPTREGEESEAHPAAEPRVLSRRRSSLPVDRSGRALPAPPTASRTLLASPSRARPSSEVGPASAESKPVPTLRLGSSGSLGGQKHAPAGYTDMMKSLKALEVPNVEPVFVYATPRVEN
mmetsp:Transcript_19636/g.52112  ORF Transcript_19636/g.52112 Transcript_19636/m.52112 type:complete len:312 (-) Transcript_19636:92-1027(-)